MSVRKSSRFMRELAIGGFEDWGIRGLGIDHEEWRQKAEDGRSGTGYNTNGRYWFFCLKPAGLLLTVLIQKAGKEIRPCLPAG